MRKSIRERTLEDAVQFVLDQLAPEGDTEGQHVLYSTALHPFKDDKTVVDFLRESLET